MTSMNSLNGSSSKMTSPKTHHHHILSPKAVKQKLQGMTKKKKQKYDTLGGESMHQSKKKKTKKTKTKVSKASQAFHTENLLKSPKGSSKKKRISNNNYNTVGSVDGDLDISPDHLLSGKHEGDDTSTVDLDLAKEALRRLLPRDVLFSSKESSSSSIQSQELSLQAQEEGTVLPDASIRKRIEAQMVRAIHGEPSFQEPGILMSLDGKELGISSLEHKLTIALTLLVFIYLPMILVILSWHFMAAQSQATPSVK